jgi:hypothetical protein
MKTLRGDFEKINTSLPSDMAKELKELSWHTRSPQAVLFREAVFDLLIKHQTAANSAAVVGSHICRTRGDFTQGETA